LFNLLVHYARFNAGARAMTADAISHRGLCFRAKALRACLRHRHLADIITRNPTKDFGQLLGIPARRSDLIFPLPQLPLPFSAKNSVIRAAMTGG